MNTLIDLTPDQITLLKNLLQLHLPERAKIWLFGSRATGSAKPFSDIDLLIDLGEPISIAMLTKLSEAFDESNLPYKVDIADASSISHEFHKNIALTLVSLDDI